MEQAPCEEAVGLDGIEGAGRGRSRSQGRWEEPASHLYYLSLFKPSRQGSVRHSSFLDEVAEKFSNLFRVTQQASGLYHMQLRSAFYLAVPNNLVNAARPPPNQSADCC